MSAPVFREPTPPLPKYEPDSLWTPTNITAWTGVLPLKWTAQAPIDDPRSKGAIAPANIVNYTRPQE